MPLKSVIQPCRHWKLKTGGTRGKTDRLDATRIALFAATRPLTQAQQIAQRYFVATQITPELSQCIGQWLKAIYEYSKKPPDFSKGDWYQERIPKLKKDIMQVEEEIIALIQNDESMAKNFNQPTTTEGVSLLHVRIMVVTNRFTSFNNSRKINCFAGLAPLENNSGSISGKTSRLKNKKIEALLINWVNNATMHESELRQYYKRKTAEEKHKMVVLNAIAFKLVHRIFAVVKRTESYVELIH